MRTKKSAVFSVCVMLGLVVVVLITGNTHSAAEQQQPPAPPVGGTPQKYPVPVTLKRVSHDDGLVLGNGVSLDRIAPAHSSPFLNPRSREVLADSKVSFHMYAAMTTSSVDAFKGANVAAKARFLFTSGEAKNEVARNTSIAAEAFRLVLVGEGEYGHDELQAPVLNPEAAKLIAAGDIKSVRTK